jgi:hypothetical protein
VADLITSFSRSFDYFPFSETDSGAGKQLFFLYMAFSDCFCRCCSRVFHTVQNLFRKRRNTEKKTLYIGIPLISWVLGIILFQFGGLTFWSVLALVAVFHFIRQQYGFMRIYARFEPNNWSKRIDEVAVYAATLYPMLYWFKTPRAFTWFVNNEFDWLQNLPDYTGFITVLYFGILMTWLIKTAFEAFKTKQLNIPKTALITGTYLSWYFGIVYFNNDLLYLSERYFSRNSLYRIDLYPRNQTKRNSQLNRLLIFKSVMGIFLFIGVILGFAFLEEFLWETLVWNEHFSLDLTVPEILLQFLVPLLVVPQLTHYLLDGFIWRKPKKVS